jgi:hypothetical protein
MGGLTMSAFDRFRRQFALNSWPLHEKDFATVAGPARMLPVVQQFREAARSLTENSLSVRPLYVPLPTDCEPHQPRRVSIR